jgi:hypothetical protein
VARHSRPNPRSSAVHCSGTAESQHFRTKPCVIAAVVIVQHPSNICDRNSPEVWDSYLAVKVTSNSGNGNFNGLVFVDGQHQGLAAFLTAEP